MGTELAIVPRWGKAVELSEAGRITLPAQDIPLARVADVLVVGGGTTGAVAAVAAARQGASTVLVEQYGFLGGTAVAAPVTYLQEGAKVQGQPVIRGIYLELKERLARFSGIDEGASIPRRSGFGELGGHNPAILQTVLLDMCQEAGVTLFLHTYFVRALTEKGKIRHAIFVNKGGLMAIEAKQFIDASGDGDLAAAAGAQFTIGRPEDGLLQPCTMIFQLANIDYEKIRSADWVHLSRLLEKECPEVVLPRKKFLLQQGRGGLAFFQNIHVNDVNAADPDDYTRAEIEGRLAARSVWQFMRRRVPGCEECIIAGIGTELGVRETRQITADYVMTRQDVLGASKFPDSIGCSTAWIDVHHTEGISIRHEFLPRGEWFEIPYRALVTAGLNNLQTVGRCMSATHEAQSAIRVIPTLIMTGEAAGVAAGLCAQSSIGTRDLEVDKLQKALASVNAYLGSAQPPEVAIPTPS